MEKEPMKTVPARTGAAACLGLAALTLSGCFAYNPFLGGPQSGGTIVGTSGPEPRWVKDYQAGKPVPKNVFIADGFDLDDADMAMMKACSLASDRANIVQVVGQTKPPYSIKGWTERTKGWIGKRYHAFCKVVKK